MKHFLSYVSVKFTFGAHVESRKQKKKKNNDLRINKSN